MKWFVVLLVACSGKSSAPVTNTSTTNETTSDATLAIFEPAGTSCVLRRFDPTLNVSTELARFAHACFGARIAWRVDLKRAAVWFEPGNLHLGGVGSTASGHPADEHDIVERFYDVDLTTQAVVALNPPAKTVELAYANMGLFAFVEHELPNAAGKVVTFEGRKLDFTQTQEGIPAAAMSYRLDGNWLLVSVVATTTGWDYAQGWSAAPESKQLGPRSFELLDAHADTKELDPATRAPLDRIAASQPDGDAWAAISSSLFVWMFNAEFTHTTGRIAWRSPDGSIALVPKLDFTAGDLVAIQTRGRYLLVAGANAGAFPRLYDTADHRLVWHSDTARAVTFWPTSSRSAN